MNTSSNKEYFQESKDEKSSSINNTIQDYNNNNNNNNLSVTIKNTNNENIKKSCNIDKKKSNKAAAIYDPLSSNNNDNNNKNNNSELNKSNIKEQTKDTMNTNTESSKTVVSSNIKKDVKSMTLEEQIAFYKDQFSKSKRLYLHYENESKKLESKYLSTFEKLKTYEPKKNEQVKILYKYTHDNNNKYYLAQSIINENTTYFIKESQMKELFNIDFSNKKDLEDNNYPEYDFEIDIKQKEETIEQMILQYDNRIKRLNEEIEKNEDIIKNSKDFKAKSIMQLEISKNFYELGIQNIITQCNDVFSKLKNTLNSDFLIYDDLTLKTEVFEELKKSIDGLKSSCILSRDNNNNNNNNINDNNLINSEKWLLENKDFICKILETFKEVIYNYSISKEEYEDQKIKWQSTLDQVIKSHEEELLKSNKN